MTTESTRREHLAAGTPHSRLAGGTHEATSRLQSDPPTGPRASNGVIVAYIVGYFLVFLALLTPVTSTLAVKVSTLSTEATRESDFGLVAAVGAFFAFVANPLAGALSDRTSSRWGMRRPWLLIGSAVGTVGLAILAFAPSIAIVALGWGIAQAALNGTLAALQAILPDQVEERRRARVSGLLGIGQSAAPLAGIGLAAWFSAVGVPSAWMIIVPGILGLLGVLVLFSLMKDRHLAKEDVAPFHFAQFARSFFINPRKHPDFAWAFVGRFLMFLGFATATGYQLYFLLARFGLDMPIALQWQLKITLVSTLATVIAAVLGGWISDRVRRRKIFVIISTVLAGLGLVSFALVSEPGQLFFASALFGFGLGAYFAVDLALVTEVLPNRDGDGAKDLGVFNIANALPQSLAPALAPLLLGVASADNSNYTLLYLVAAGVVLVGATTTMFIKGAR